MLRDRFCHRCPIVAAVFVSALAPVAWAGMAAVGNCNPPNVEVRAKVSMRNKTGQDADDFHFYMYQNDRPSVVVTGAKASSADCNNVNLALKNDNGHKNPPPGNHGAQVDMTGCTIPDGEAVTVEVSLCMNEKNVLKLKDAEFTSNGMPLPGPPKPKGGFRVRRPFRGGNGGNRAPGGGGMGAQEGNGGSGHWIHRVCIENDDSRWLVLDELKLLASMTFYANPDTDINWAAIVPIQNALGEPPVCIPPGGRWCYFFQTTGSYLNGHIYKRFSLRVALAGECGPAPVPLLNNNNNDVDDDGVLMFGDHPVDGVIGAYGLDYWTTVQPTAIEFGGSVPAVPADFFHPGCDPFVGPVYLSGAPFAPEFANADTVVERLAELGPDPVQSVPIELIELNLKSVEPITVTAHQTVESLFDVLEPGSTHLDGAPVQVGVSNDGGLSIDTEMIQLSLAETSPPLVPRLDVQDAGGPMGLFGTPVFLELFTELSPPAGVDTFVDLFVESTQPLGTDHFPMLPPTVFLASEGLAFDILFGDMIISPQTTQAHNLHCEVPPGQAVQITGVEVLGHTGQSFFHVMVQLQITGPLVEGLPLLSGMMQGFAMQSSESLYDVYVGLDLQQPSVGTMTVEQSPSGNTFTTDIALAPEIIFAPAGGAPDPNLVLPGVAPIAIQSSAHAWQETPTSLAVPGSGPTFFPDGSLPLTWVAPDGTPHTVAVGSPAPLPLAPADFDEDGDVDLDDFQALADCGTGPAIPYDAASLPPDCPQTPGTDGTIPADLDGDHDVDMKDFAAFQRCISGAFWQADPNCGH